MRHIIEALLLSGLAVFLSTPILCKGDDAGTGVDGGSGTTSTTSALSRAVGMQVNRQPYIPRPTQDQAADDKLQALFDTFAMRPNILWITIDDVGFGDFGGAWGGGAHIGAATPNIDRMAREGLALLSTYSQPTCTPTRSAMMLGRLPYRTGLIRPILAGDVMSANPWVNETNIAELLSAAGYHTVCTGKWHCGEDPGLRPIDVGFDEFQGYYTSQKELTQQMDERRYPDLVLNEELLASFLAANGGSKIAMFYGRKSADYDGGNDEESDYGTEAPLVNTTSIAQFAEADQILAQFTIDKMEQLTAEAKTASANGEPAQPFFIAHNFMRCHADNWASAEFKGSSAAKYPYKDNLVEVDSIVGRFLETLESLRIAENTFVFLTSDNGPQRDSWPDAGYTPFRGGKSTTWEGGVRVPGIAYWKGTIVGGRESAELFDLMDLYSTAAHIAGADVDVYLDDSVYLDGIDQTSFLLADDGHSKREHVYLWAQTTFMALRMREYKWHKNVILEQNTWNTIDYSTIDQVAMAPWLFNLYIDPKEEMPVGHRRNAWLSTMGAEASLHIGTFAPDAYPPKDVGLEQ